MILGGPEVWTRYADAEVQGSGRLKMGLRQIALRQSLYTARVGFALTFTFSAAATPIAYSFSVTATIKHAP